MILARPAGLTWRVDVPCGPTGGRWQLDVRDGGFRNRNMNNYPSQVLTVRPVKVFAHVKGDPFGATTHRF